MTRADIDSTIVALRKIEKQYAFGVSSMVKHINSLLRDETNPERIVSIIEDYGISERLANMVKSSTERMVNAVDVEQTKMLRKAASASVNGRDVLLSTKGIRKTEYTKSVIQRVSSEAAEDARRIPDSVACSLRQYMFKQRALGASEHDISVEMKNKVGSLFGYNIRRMSRYEVSRASSEFTMTREYDYGGQWYVWETRKDERVRDSHVRMQGVLCSWNDPPSPEGLFGGRSYGRYHPGGTYNCRCVALPVISLRDIPYPARVHYHNRIVIFKNISELISFLRPNGYRT